MLIRSPLLRVDRVLRFVCSYVQPKPARHFQGFCFYHSLNSGKGMSAANCTVSAVNMKKQKMVACMGRPVSTEASSAEACAEEIIMSSEEVGIKTDLTSSTNLTEGNIQSEVLEGKSLRDVEKHSLKVEVGSSLMRFIRGKQGATQKKIEEEMDVKIFFPSSKNDDFIVIEGISLDVVTKASEAVQAIIKEAVNSSSFPYSHFVSLPLAIYPELVHKLVNFQNNILGTADLSLDKKLGNDSAEDNSDNEDKEHSRKKACSVNPNLRIDRSIFINPKTFHLTVLMLKLWKKDQVNAAVEVLKNVSPEVMTALDNQPVFIRLKGLDRMKGSLSKARVVYATVEEIVGDGRLVRACNVIINAFKQAGLVLEDDASRNLKLHATVMNVSHRKGRAKKRNDSFDARGVFEQFGAHDWGEYLIREAHLSQRFVYDENGYYHCCASIPFPATTPPN